MASGIGPMSGILATRRARRRAIAYTILLATTVILMAVSSSPPILELQRGIGFALRPVQSFLTDVSRGIDSISAAVTEIDQLRKTNEALQLDNQRLAAENARLEEIKRENEQLTALLQLRSGLEYKTVAAEVSFAVDPDETGDYFIQYKPKALDAARNAGLSDGNANILG